VGNIFYFVYTLIYIYLIVYAYRLTPRKDLQYWFFLAVMGALFYDCFISGIGFLIGDGQFLSMLNYLRFAMHVFITPTLCYIAFKLAQKMKVGIAQGKAAEIVVWFLIAVFIVWGFIHDLAPMDLVPETVWGVLAYTHATPSVPIPVILINFVVIIASICIWKKTGWPGLFITSIIMMFVGAIQVESLGQIPGNAGEILFIYGFLLAQKKVLKNTVCEHS